MNELPTRLIITKHAYTRYRERVGKMPPKVLHERSQTALLCGLYRHGEGVIRLNGIWWGYVADERGTVLVTCYGRQEEDMIKQRRDMVGSRTRRF